MSDKYLSLNELADWAAGELYDVKEETCTILGMSVSGVHVLGNYPKIELLRKIIDNPDAAWSNTGIDDKIIMQIRSAKHDPSDSAKEFMHAINMFAADVFKADIWALIYAYEHIEEINNRLVKTDWIGMLLSPLVDRMNMLTDEQRAKLSLELFLSYPYTDLMLIDPVDGRSIAHSAAYSITRNYDMAKVFDWVYDLMWSRIMAEATKPEPDVKKIENLCNIAIVKLMGIKRWDPTAQRVSFLLHDVFNIDFIFNYVKGHAEEISQHDTFLDQIRMNEAQATMYQRATAKRLNQQHTEFVHQETNSRSI